ncbi:MAG: ribulose-phosphate 3-epimerase, partial [Lachnospiraceae bacterium]|nr:ribulose-phosphate 3-epimerase [Lachnospiraceae bacterium]
PDLDMVLIMTVNPGYGGQTLIPYTLDKVRDLRSMIRKKGLNTDIEVDGGINLDNVSEVLDAGANIIVSGSSVFRGDINDNVEQFLEIMR